MENSSNQNEREPLLEPNDQETQVIPNDQGTGSGTRKKKRRGLSNSCWCALLLFWILVIVLVVTGGVTLSIVMAGSQDRTEEPTSISAICGVDCKITIVESIPENMSYPLDAPTHKSTYDSWMWLLQEATSTIEIASYYWTLRGSENISDPSDYKGTDVYEGLINAHSRGVSIRVVQTIPTNDYQWNDSLALSNLGVIELRSLDLNKLIGTGILHTKLWIVDGQHFYVGSANTDWRALTQVKELGLFGQNCSCLADDALKIFEVYWKVSDPSVTEIPPDWPDSLSANFNMSQPASLPVNNISANIFWASSPPQLSTNYRTDDITALLNVIESATSFVYIAVMNYEPAIIYSKPEKYWPVIDDALRKAAYDKGIEVRLLGSHWNHTSCDMKRFLNSLGSWDDIGRLNGSIETKYFVVPQLNDTFIPFTRVNHNKYMVTDNAAYIGTSNWSGDYFVSTGGVSLISNQTQSMLSNNDSVPIQKELRLIFERDWNSEYSFDIDDVHQPYCSS